MQYFTKEFLAFFKELEKNNEIGIPSEFKEIVAQQPLIANKQFYYVAKLEASTVLEDKLPKIVMDHYKASKAVSTFLAKAMEA